MKAIRCTELYVTCSKCKRDITIIPNNDIDKINIKNPELVKCSNCNKILRITKIIS